MEDAPAWTREHAPAMRNHWWWRPGWREGRRFWTWHITFEGADELHQIVDAYQAALRTHLTVDLIPHQWLHLTVQGVGFVDEVTTADVHRIRESVVAQLRELPLAEVAFGPAVVRPEAIALPPTPLAPLVAAKRAIRTGIAEVWGAEHIPESAGGFQPHLSVAYSNSNTSSEGIVEAVGRVQVDRTVVPLNLPRMIELNRDQKIYQWVDSEETGMP